MRPRQALVRFRVPYEAPPHMEYLAGDIYLQPFTKRSSIEARLHVAQPDQATGEYAKALYDCKAHEVRWANAPRIFGERGADVIFVASRSACSTTTA